jgi:alpha-L-fucosidase
VFALTIDPEPGYAVKELFFTQKDGNVYAMLPSWPENGLIEIRDIDVSNDTVVTMLGVDTPLKHRKKKDGIQVTLPRVLPGRLPSEYIWTLKISSAR